MDAVLSIPNAASTATVQLTGESSPHEASLFKLMLAKPLEVAVPLLGATVTALTSEQPKEVSTRIASFGRKSLIGQKTTEVSSGVILTADPPTGHVSGADGRINCVRADGSFFSQKVKTSASRGGAPGVRNDDPSTYLLGASVAGDFEGVIFAPEARTTELAKWTEAARWQLWRVVNGEGQVCGLGPNLGPAHAGTRLCLFGQPPIPLLSLSAPLQASPRVRLRLPLSLWTHQRASPCPRASTSI